MANNYFVTSVADARLFDFNDNLVATSKVLMDSSIEVTTSNTDVRGGKGNALQFIYWHSGDLSVTLTDTQFNLAFLAESVGDTLTTGADVYAKETVTLGAGGAGTVLGTPKAIQGTSAYGWITHDGVDTEERVMFSGSGFTSTVGAENDVVCVYYYKTDSAAKQMKINSNIVPNKLRLVLDAQLAEKNDSSANVIGKVEFIVPKFQLSGAFSLTMTADQVMQTPITGRALETAVTSNGCSASGVLAYVTRVIDDANWYDDVEALAFVGGDVALTHPDTYQTTVRAVHTDGGVSTPPVADLTFATDAAGTATISSAGLITSVAAGTTYASVTITSKTSIDASIEVVIS